MSDIRLTLTKAQKRAAVQRLGENLAVRSGAGSGKTYVLARRFTELLMNHPDAEDPLSHFVALTFTDKAAIEMSDRVRRMLLERVAVSKGEDRRRLIRWVQELPDAQISTIHSFCASLLRAHGVLVGVDPNFAVCPDDVTMKPLRRQAADETLLSAIKSENSDAMNLLSQASYDEILRRTITLVDNRTNDPLTAYADADVIFHRWEKLWLEQRKREIGKLKADDELREKFDELKRIKCDDPADKLLPIRDGFVEAVGAVFVASEQELPAALEKAIAFQPGRVGGKAWEGGATAVRHRIKDIAAQLEDVLFYFQPLGDADRLSAGTLAALARLAILSCDAYSSAKRRRGMLDFTDLLYYAAQLLATRPEIARNLRERIDQLLIDEAQDTDAFQLKMLLGLIFPDGNIANDDGRLFIVGDAKQSIYRFRGAQVEVFEDLCDDLSPARQESLDTSFRTHEAGIEFVNELFSKPKLLGDNYEPLRAHRGESPSGPSVEILLADAPGDERVGSAAEAADLQAAVTAERIRQMVQSRERTVWDASAKTWRAAEYGDIAILFSRMTESSRYERHLADRNVPYYVIGGADFFNRQEIYDIATVLAAIDNPFDDIALFGVLRSDMVGIDDETLMRISQACEKPYLPVLREMIASGEATAIPDADRSALEMAVDMIDTLRACKDALPIDELIRRVLEITGYEAVLLAQPDGKRMVANVRRLMEMARAASDEYAALADFLTQMEEVRMDESRFEQADVADENDSVVRLMTIHKAKGLEFPVVILPDLNVAHEVRSVPLLYRADWGWTCKLFAKNAEKNGEEDKSSAYRAALRHENKDQLREDIRKLYVAVTIHMDRLIFVGAEWHKKEKQKEPDDFQMKGSYLSLLNEALGILPMPTDEKPIAYADGKYELIVRRVQPSAQRKDRSTGRNGRRILREAGSTGEIARKIITASDDSGGATCPLTGPLPKSLGRVEIGVTALGDFAHCPTLYRWRHELRALPESPELRDGAPNEPKNRGETVIDPLTLGSILHKCLELLDFDHPQSADAILAAALSELGLDELASAATLDGVWEKLLGKFLQSQLFKDVTSAERVYRELDFIMDAGVATLRGQVDLACVISASHVKIIDYKSDQIPPDRAAERAGRYELQLLLYAAAMVRYFEAGSVEAEVYFLRPSVTHRLEISEQALHDGCEKASSLAEELIAARRSGQFARKTGIYCRWCPYRRICEA